MNSRLHRWLASFHYGDFIVGNGLAFLFFPVVSLVGTFCFFNNDLKLATFIAVYSLTHFAVLWCCLVAHGQWKRLRIPISITALAIMFYNRHMDSWVDDSPFGSAVTLYDQRIFGLIGYLRIFDKPNDEYGVLEFDPVGLFVGLEVLVFVTFLWGLCFCLYDRMVNVIRGNRTASRWLDEPPHSV